jgi:hypothetical protein
MTADTFLFNAGSIFFAAWIAIIAAVTITAFGRDLLQEVKFESAQERHPTRPSDSRIH